MLDVEWPSQLGPSQVHSRLRPGTRRRPCDHQDRLHDGSQPSQVARLDGSHGSLPSSSRKKRVPFWPGLGQYAALGFSGHRRRRPTSSSSARAQLRPPSCCPGARAVTLPAGPACCSALSINNPLLPSLALPWLPFLAMIRSVRQVRSFPSLKQATAFQASANPQLQQQRSLASTVLLTSWTQARVPDLKEELKKRGLSTYVIPVCHSLSGRAADPHVVAIATAKAPARRPSSSVGSRNTRPLSPRCPRPAPPRRRRPRRPRRSLPGSPTARLPPPPVRRSRLSTASRSRPRCDPA
jgi:hypothetical protein